ncbi:MAG: hypothetical protein GXP31_06320 [Kiritimatiellaeota bacterium]|nr:hypothetical protein [Kiritimatiellota bacterium]
MKTLLQRTAIAAAVLLAVDRTAHADGPHLPPGQEGAIVGRSLAAPREYDIFFGKRDRQYLTGVWKMKWEWNYLTRDWIKRNMVRKFGRSTGLWIKSGITPPHREVPPRPGYLDIRSRADGPSWWDVLVPGPWQDLMPYEKEGDRKICDQYMDHRKRYVFGGVGFYRKVFTTPAKERGSSVVLHFDNVESICTVWVNGKNVGSHKNFRMRGEGWVTGAFLDGFDLDITSAVHFGADNLVTVRVYDSGVPIPWGSPDSGGITGVVWVEYLAPAYFETMLVTAPYGAGRVNLKCRPAGKRPVAGTAHIVVRPWQSPDYRFPGKVRRTYAADVRLSKPHNGWIELAVDTPGILAWSPEAPNLYEVRVTDSAGRIMALERFGVRTFEARGNRFFLNNRPVYLFGKNSGELIEGWGLRSKEAMNYHNIARNQFRGKRAANFNSQRIHTGPAPRLAYYLCDEAGLMVRDEWTPSDLRPLPFEQQTADFRGTHDVSASFTADGKALLPALKKRLERWIEWNYNSPCVITWSAGNEMAAGDPNVRKYLTLLYEFMLEHDPQKRPYTPSSGLHWERGDPKLRSLPLPAGYLDFHNYRMIYSRWIGCAAAINREADELSAIYGGLKVPVVVGEWLAHGGLDNRLCYIDPSVFDKTGAPVVDRYVRMIRDATTRRKPTHPRISREFLGRIAVGGCRIARSYLDDARARADYYRHCVEIMRRDVPRVVGYSIHGWKPFVNQKPDPKTKRVAGDWGGPEFEALRMAQQPLIAIPDFWEKHAFSGQALQFKVSVINWSAEPFDGVLRLQLETADGHAAATAENKLPLLSVGQTLVVPAKLDIPSRTASAPCRLVLDLVAQNHRLSRNVHRVLVRAKTGFPPVVSQKRVVLYEKEEGPDSTQALLKAFGVNFTRSRELTDFADADVLVIGRKSIDGVVSKQAAVIRRFIEQGGRVLVFRQELAAPLPWAPALRIESCGPVPNADPIAMNHPVLAGIQPEDLRDWGADHVVYDHWLTPLGGNVLAAGASPRTGFAHARPADFGMILAEFRLGKGASFLCQLRLEENVRTDSAARTVARSIFHYAFETPWPVAAVVPLEGDTGGVSDQPILTRKDVRFIRLNKFVNRSLADADGSGWMGLGFGLDGLPLGNRLFGYVPFGIDSKGMAIVLGATPARADVFPTERKGIGVWTKARALFFLHTAAYVKAADGAVLVKYVIHYGPKKQVVFQVRNRTDIADWYKPRSLSNAKVVWSSGDHGVYLARWVNPHPEKKISTIDVIAGSKGYVGILAITAALAK